MNTFQIILIAVFILAAIVAVLIFAGFIPGFKSEKQEEKVIKVTLWGSLNKAVMEEFLSKLKEKNDKITFVYTEKKSENFEMDLINSLSDNDGPDLWLMPQDLILKHKKKIIPISFDSLSLRNFTDTFVDEGKLFLNYSGKNITALPFFIDPITLYYNKTILNNAVLTSPPQNWDDFLNYSRLTTIRDENQNIVVAGAALGEYANINNAKQILSAMFFQANDQIIQNSSLSVVLGNEENKKAVISALAYYTDFANSRKSAYSWNRFLDKDFNMFLKGKLAFYFGAARELNEIKQKNPNLNFDVSVIPQPKQGGVKSTFGNITGIAVSSKTKIYVDALYAAKFLVSYDAQKLFSETFFLPSSRRDVLSEKTSDLYMPIFNESAIISRGFIDPNSEKTSFVFKNMIESVNRREKSPSQAVSDARSGLDRILKDYRK